MPYLRDYMAPLPYTYMLDFLFFFIKNSFKLEEKADKYASYCGVRVVYYLLEFRKSRSKISKVYVYMHTCECMCMCLRRGLLS